MTDFRQFMLVIQNRMRLLTYTLLRTRLLFLVHCLRFAKIFIAMIFLSARIWHSPLTSS